MLIAIRRCTPWSATTQKLVIGMFWGISFCKIWKICQTYMAWLNSTRWEKLLKLTQARYFFRLEPGRMILSERAMALATAHQAQVRKREALMSSRKPAIDQTVWRSWHPTWCRRISGAEEKEGARQPRELTRGQVDGAWMSRNEIDRRCCRRWEYINSYSSQASKVLMRYREGSICYDHIVFVFYFRKKPGELH